MPHPRWKRKSEPNLKLPFGSFAGTAEVQQGQLEESTAGSRPFPAVRRGKTEKADTVIS